jgi:hypothetical protein
VLVLRGEAGIGKTALMQYLLDHASGCRIARAVGVESEMELAFAGLHQLCAPMLTRLGHLPEPQGIARDHASRSVRNAARISVAKSSGSSHAAKWAPLSTLLK